MLTKYDTTVVTYKGPKVHSAVYLLFIYAPQVYSQFVGKW